MLYISYIINIFHTLFITCINYIFLFPAKIFPVGCLSVILYNYYFNHKLLIDFFSNSIITTVHFFDT